MDAPGGTSIGGYTLIKLLGVGGMGSVYLANDPTIDQQVAVKIIRTDIDAYTDSASAQMALERFRQEARAVARLDHLHILPLYRYGEEATPQGQRAYMIMQYRPEGSLWDWLRRRADIAAGTLQPTRAELSSGLPTAWPMGLEEVSEYLQQAASALQYAHDRGIVHRDIKPANFLLRIDLHDRAVHLLLSDFGLAKVFTASSATNTILGTPTYMAPEQFEGAARPESDQYALAVMIYYLLAGRAPFEGDPMQLMRQHLSAEMPSLTTFNPRVPPYMNGILARALAKKPEQRFPSVAAFAEAFARVTQQRPSSLAPLSTPGAPSPLPGRPGLLNLPSHNQAAQVSPGPLVLPDPAIGASYHTPVPTVYPTPSPLPQAPTIGPMFMPASTPGYPPRGVPRPQEQQVSRRGALGWILGGAALGLAGAGAGVYFYEKSNNPSASSNGPGPASPTPASPSPSPSVQPSPALHVLRGHTAAVTSLSWAPGGSQLVSGSLDATARIWSTADGSPVATIKATSEVRSVAWSPNGTMLATGEEDRTIQLWNTVGSLLRRELLWGAPIDALAWRGNSWLFIGTVGNNLHALNTVTHKHYGKSSAVSITSLAFSPSETLLAVALTNGEVYFADMSHSTWPAAGTLPAAYGEALSVAWSPDGNSVVVGYAGNYAVVYNVHSRMVQYTLRHSAPVYSVAWSPNSTATAPLLVTGAGDGSVNLWNLAGKGNQTVYHGHSSAVLAVSWSSSMLASASKDQTVILWKPPNA